MGGSCASCCKTLDRTSHPSCPTADLAQAVAADPAMAAAAVVGSVVVADLEAVVLVVVAAVVAAMVGAATAMAAVVATAMVGAAAAATGVAAVTAPPLLHQPTAVLHQTGTAEAVTEGGHPRLAAGLALHAAARRAAAPLCTDRSTHRNVPVLLTALAVCRLTSVVTNTAVTDP